MITVANFFPVATKNLYISIFGNYGPKCGMIPFFPSFCLFYLYSKAVQARRVILHENKGKAIAEHSKLGHNSSFSLNIGIPRLAQIFNLTGMKCRNLHRIYQLLVHLGICGIKMFGLIHSFRKYATWETFKGLQKVYPLWKTTILPYTPNWLGSVWHFLHFICIIITSQWIFLSDIIT